jgi:hypothetical protein
MQQNRSGVNLWSGNELVLFYEGRGQQSIYICGRHSSAKLQQAAATAVAIDVSYPHSVSPVVSSENAE